MFDVSVIKYMPKTQVAEPIIEMDHDNPDI